MSLKSVSSFDHLVTLEGLTMSSPPIDGVVLRYGHLYGPGTGTNALGAGVRRLVAQSIAWMYAPGKEPHSEDDVLDIDAGGTRAITVAGVATAAATKFWVP
jgi:hypothetical protein